MSAPLQTALTGDVRNVYIANPADLPIVGGLYVGPAFYPPPMDLDAPVPDVFTRLGYVSEEGVKESEDRPTTEVFAWGGDQVAEPQEKYSLKWQYKLYEFLNPEVAKVAYGAANVTVKDATATAGRRLSIVQNSRVLDLRSWLLVTFSATGSKARKYLPYARVVSKGEATWAHKDVLAHDLTTKSFPDQLGNNAYTETDDGLPVPAIHKEAA